MKLIRVAVCVVMLVFATLLFTVVSAKVAIALNWVARIQIFPLAMAGAATAVAIWLAVTLLFGRVYCSSVCPLGVVQDIFSRLRHGDSRHPFHFSQPRNRLRYAVLVIVAVGSAVGIGAIPSLLDPYSAFGRMASDLARPVVEFLGGAEVVAASWLAILIAVATLALVGWFSFRHGRIICNTVCPVGSALSIFSRYSLFHFDIDTDLCINCRKCEHSCKAECISMDDHVVDGSRCVACFNCVDACDSGAIRYTHRRKKLSLPMMQRIGNATAAPCGSNAEPPAIKDDAAGKTVSSKMRIDRRQFLATGLIIAAAPALEAVARGAFPGHGNGQATPIRPVAPPGRRSMKDFLDRCTGCGLCVAHCPSKVLAPSVKALGWLHMLHPVMNYNRASCLYDCTLCTELCPTGALMPLTPAEKHIFIIGHARVEPANCIGCGRCAAKCPRNAITLAPRPDSIPGRSKRIAHVDTSLCIGCGSCQHICPVTSKAIVVDGII